MRVRVEFGVDVNPADFVDGADVLEHREVKAAVTEAARAALYDVMRESGVTIDDYEEFE